MSDSWVCSECGTDRDLSLKQSACPGCGSTAIRFDKKETEDEPE